MKQNVLILLTASYGGGAERLVLDQMNHFDKGKFNLHVITLREGNLEKEFRKNKDATYHCLNFKKKFSFKALKKINDYVAIKKINIIHTHLIESDMYGALVKLTNPKIKLFSTKHNTNEFRKNTLVGISNKLFSILTNKIFCVSESVKKFVSKYEFISSNKLEVVYNGVDVNKFIKYNNLDVLRNSMGIEKQSFVIGIVGRLTTQKGHIFLFKAISLLKGKIPSLKVLVVGEGTIRKELEMDVIRLGIENHVKFLGFRKDMPQLYSLMDVLCLPSLFEGFGLVVVEAMLCGTIVVGSRIDGIMEIIDDGVNGFLVEPRNTEILAEVFNHIYLNANKKKITEAAFVKALKLFDFDKNLRKIENRYICGESDSAYLM